MNAEESCAYCREPKNVLTGIVFPKEIDLEARDTQGISAFEYLMANKTYATPTVLELYQTYLDTNIPLAKIEIVHLLYYLYNTTTYRKLYMVYEMLYELKTKSPEFQKIVAMLILTAPVIINRILANNKEHLKKLLYTEASFQNINVIFALQNSFDPKYLACLSEEMATFVVLNKKVPMGLNWDFPLYVRYNAGQIVVFRSNAHLLNIKRKMDARMMLLCGISKLLVLLIIHYVM